MNAAPHPTTYRPDESLLSIWSRRVLSITLYLTLALVCIVGAPLWLAATAVADLATGSARTFPRTRALCFFAVYFACELAGVAVASLIWLVTIGGRIGGTTSYLWANAALQYWWARTLFKGCRVCFSMKVEIEGHNLVRGGPLLVFVRHTSTADTVLAATFVAHPRRLLLRYVLKRELLWDPCLDIVGRRLPNAFVKRTGTHRQSEIELVAQLGEGLDEYSGVLIYPEGTRFTPSKLESRISTLRARGSEKLAAIASGFRNVLPPRLGGPLALFDAAPGVDLLLLEHTGFEGAESFAEFWGGGLIGKLLRIRFRRFAAEAIPASGREEWLFERWAEMDDWVTRSKAAGAHAP